MLPCYGFMGLSAVGYCTAIPFLDCPLHFYGHLISMPFFFSRLHYTHINKNIHQADNGERVHRGVHVQLVFRLLFTCLLFTD
ncbi:hypothetical protein F4810DRAFT_262997 [Camillea tinctor]|nr:hypothetical protein F4810DRAFT_262997 [Camillea tinctor]